MPPKNNTSWWSARLAQQALENSTREPKNLNSEPGPANVRNQEEPQMMLGMSELIEFINALATAAPGTRPQMNAEQLEKIKKSPLKPVLQALQPIYRKIVDEPEKPPPAEARYPSIPQLVPSPEPGPSSAQEPHPIAALDAAELKDIEAGVKLLSSKLDAVSQAVADVATQKVMGSNFRTLEDNLRQADSETREAVKASATVSKTHFEAVDSKISQMSGKLDPALHELSQGIKKLQVGLAENARGDKARLEAKVNELEKEVKELQQVIDATRTELLPVEVASKIALQGTFTEDADKASTRAGAALATGSGNVVQTAKRVRTNTLGLIAKCWALFTFINRDPTTGSNVPDLGMEGEWGRCAEHLRASNTRLRSSIEEKEESAQKLQFFGFVVDQIRKGRYTEKEWTSGITGKRFVTLIENSPDGFASIQLLAQDISRLTAPVLPIAPVYGIPPTYETPPATPAANATFQAPNLPMAYAGASTAKPTTGGTRPWVRGNASTNHSSAATSSLAGLLSS